VSDHGIIKKDKTYDFKTTKCAPEDKGQSNATGPEISNTASKLGAAIVVIKSSAQSEVRIEEAKIDVLESVCKDFDDPKSFVGKVTRIAYVTL